MERTWRYLASDGKLLLFGGYVDKPLRKDLGLAAVK